MARQIHNPRTHLTHEIQVGQVYGNRRTETKSSDGSVSYNEKFRLVHLDDERVVLRSNKKIPHGEARGDHHYRCDHRDTFEREAAEGMYVLLEEAEGAPPKPSEGLVALLAVVKQHRDNYRYNINCGAGRKDKHKLEALEELIEELETLNPTEIQWESISGVGAKTAQNLRDAGFTTDADVLAASDEQLLALGGVGDGNLQNIRDRSESA